MSDMMTGRHVAALCAILLLAPLLGCGGNEAPSKASQTRAPQGTPTTGGGERIQDSGAPGEAGGAPQDPAGQDAPSPRAPTPVAP